MKYEPNIDWKRVQGLNGTYIRTDSLILTLMEIKKNKSYANLLGYDKAIDEITDFLIQALGEACL